MTRALPPFAAVRAFEAAARHLSYSRAADELALSPSAISHQVRSLEEFLDTKLFERRGNAMVLTLTGEGYAGRLTTLLDGIDESTRAAAGEGPLAVLRVLSTPGFAARFVVPRLNSFRHADRLRLRVSVGAPDTDFSGNDADLVIHWADDPVSGCALIPLMKTGRFPVISPRLREEAQVREPRDLTRLTLMHDETMDKWGEWFAAAGVPAPEMPRGPTFPNCELATTAAEQGLGVALAYDHMVRGTLESGRLVRLFEDTTEPFTIYSIVYPDHLAADPLLCRFRDWLLAQIEPDGRP